MQSVLELRQVSKDFPGHRAVDNVSLKLERGGFYALLGPSGCGKTTTLRMIGGFEQPSAGEVLLVEDVTGKGHLSQAVGGQVRHSVFIPIE